MPAKKDNTTMIRIYNETNEAISTIKRQLSASENKDFDNPDTIQHIVDFYMKGQQKGKQ